MDSSVASLVGIGLLGIITALIVVLLIQLSVTRGMVVAAAAQARDAASLSALRAVETAQEVKRMTENVQKIELATNSMKDALVAATKETGELVGEKRERDAEALRQAARMGETR